MIELKNVNLKNIKMIKRNIKDIPEYTTLRNVDKIRKCIEGMKNVKMEGFDNPAEGVVDFVVLAKVKRSDIFKNNRKEE